MKSLVFILTVYIALSFADDCTVTDFEKLQNAIDKCLDIIISNLDVPAGETLALNLNKGTHVTFKGNITFGYTNWTGPLVAINGTNIAIEGDEGSVLNGQGELYWDGLGEWGKIKPKFFIIQLHDSVMKNIYVLNSPVHCVLLTDSSDVELSGWTIDNKAGDEDVEPENFGHNTDGFDVFNSTNVVLKDASIYNQDDCVAVRSGDNILIDNFYCHGGHGLSISVGFSNETEFLNTLSNVTFSNSVLEKGENGIHIKTHIDSINGSMHNIYYTNISIHDPVNYGINIQQNYKNMPANSSFPAEPDNNIPITNLQLTDIKGTVAKTAVPVYILCADEGCFDWKFSNVAISGSKYDSCNYAPEGFVCHSSASSASLHVAFIIISLFSSWLM